MPDEMENPWAPVFDAGMAFQRELVESAKGVVESGIALQRAGLRSTEQMIRATDPRLWIPRDVAERGVAAWMATAPGVTRDSADRLSREFVESTGDVNPWMGQPARELRDATLRTMHEAEDFLEETGHAAERSFNELSESLRRVSDEGREAMVRMTRATRESGKAAAPAATGAAEPKAARRGKATKAKKKTRSRR